MADKCKHTKAILGKFYISDFEPDSEPYKAGRIETIPARLIAGAADRFLVGHYCPKCDEIVDAVDEETSPAGEKGKP